MEYFEYRKYCKRSTIHGIQESKRNILKAITSRSLYNARAFADELGIQEAYGSYEKLLNDPTIDVVYIQLSNQLHKEWALKAAKAGKHILCKKPIALDETEVIEMIDARNKAGVILAKVYMYRHQKRYEDIKTLIHNREIHGMFTFYGAGDAGNIRFTKEWGGGSIYDVGCYPISAARFLFDEEPSAVTTRAFFSPDHGDVDMMASGIMEFSNGVALTFDCGMWAEFRNELEILGSKGRIVMKEAFIRDQSYEIIKDGETTKVSDDNINFYTSQADNFAEGVLDVRPIKFPPDDIIHNIRAVKRHLLPQKNKK